MHPGNKKWIYLAILSLIWGSSFILIKKGLIGLTPLQLGALRIVISGIFIFIFGFHTLKNIKVKQWKWLIISGFIGTFFPAFLFAFAETEIDSAVASILNSLTPLNTILIGFSIFKIASSTRQIIGVIIGFIGTALLILKGADLNPDQNYLYAGFVVMATIMYGTNVNIIKKHLQEVKAITIAVGNFTAIMIPAIIVLFSTDFVDKASFQNEAFVKSVGYVIILSAFGTAMAKVLFNKLVQMSTPVFASSVTYSMPVVALIWGVLDGEGFSVIQGLATILILLGIYMANKNN
ncbi:DMT family transporter [Flavobacteriaceae sp. LMIT009]